MNELRNILTSLGLNPIWASVIIILTSVIIFSLKQHLSLKKKLKEIQAEYESKYRGKIDDRLIAYSRLQVEALLNAYKKLYENDSMDTAKRDDFVKNLKEANILIMDPLIKYSSFLDDSTKAIIYRINNILEQFKYNPSDNSIKTFKNYKGRFFNHVEETIKAIHQTVVRKQEA